MRTIIMAAGTSNRLKPLTNTIPKTLLRLGEKTILEHIMDTAYAAGVRHFDIVSGHGHSAVEEAAKEYQQRHADVNINVLYNDVYDSTGNVVSLARAKEVFDEDFVIINSDTIFHADILKDLLASPQVKPHSLWSHRRRCRAH
jgi:choline kinase